MNQRQSWWFRMEYGVAAAVILTACGHVLIVTASFVVWCAVRAFRPWAPTLAALAASIYIATAVLSVLDSVTGRGSLATLAEVFLVGIVAVILLVRGTRLCAYFLIAHSVFVVVTAILRLLHPEWATAPTEAAVSALALNTFMILLLAEHLRITRAVVAPVLQTPPSDATDR